MSLHIGYDKSRGLSFSDYFSSSDAQSLSLVIFRTSFAELHVTAILFYSKFINRMCIFAERIIRRLTGIYNEISKQILLYDR